MTSQDLDVLDEADCFVLLRSRTLGTSGFGSESTAGIQGWDLRPGVPVFRPYEAVGSGATMSPYP